MPISWHHHDGGIGVFLRTRKNRQKNCGGKMFMQFGESIRELLSVQKRMICRVQKCINKDI